MSTSRRQFLHLGTLAAASAALPSCAGSGNPDPRENAAHWNQRQLAAIASGAIRHGPQGYVACEDGSRVASWDPGFAPPSLSITKTLATLAATRASSEGWLDPSETAADTLTEWRGDSVKSRITVLMLLQQTSGLESGVIPLYRAHPADKGRTAVSLNCINPPGSVFRYGPGHWESLGEILRRKLSRRGLTLRGFMNDTVLFPIGLRTANWRSDSRGTPYLSTGVELSLNSLVRLGETLARLLDSRDCHGFNAARFASLTRASSANPMFGGGLWRNRNASHFGANAIEIERHIDAPLPASFWRNACLSTSQPAELTALIGSGGKRLYLWPSRQKIIARLGASGSWSDTGFLAGF